MRINPRKVLDKSLRRSKKYWINKKINTGIFPKAMRQRVLVVTKGVQLNFAKKKKKIYQA